MRSVSRWSTTVWTRLSKLAMPFSPPAFASAIAALSSSGQFRLGGSFVLGLVPGLGLLFGLRCLRLLRLIFGGGFRSFRFLRLRGVRGFRFSFSVS